MPTKKSAKKTAPPTPTPESKPNDLLTVHQAAARLACSAKTVRKLIRRRELPALRFSPDGPFRIAAADLEKLVESLKLALQG